MSALTEGQHPAEFLLSEAPGTISREKVTVTVPAATTLPAGMVLGKVTADGTYIPYDNAGSDGEEVAAAILYASQQNEDATYAADVEATIIARIAEVRKADLKWDAGQDANDIAAGLVDLAGKYILARD